MVDVKDNPDRPAGETKPAGPADLVIGLIDPKAGDDLSRVTTVVREAMNALSRPVEAVVVFKSGFNAPVTLDSENNGRLRFATYAPSAVDVGGALAQQVFNDFRAITAASDGYAAKSYALVFSDVEHLSAQWIHQLIAPLIDNDFDLVTPCYVFHKFEAILNNAILYPLTRALYGKRILNPLGPDFGISQRFLRQTAQVETGRTRPGVVRTYTPFGPEAASRGLRVCQTNLGTRNSAPIDWKNLSTLLADVLGPIFAGMERDAPVWQRVRGSEPIPSFGGPLETMEDTATVDVRRLLEPFQLGFRNLYEIWALLLPPKTLFEIQRLSRLSADQYHMPDELWVRIIYDFSLGYRLRTISRDHLLRALTPLYLGWIASYAIETEKMTALEAQHRVERLCAAYESGKPYLVSRWRWPDRFNP